MICGLTLRWFAMRGWFARPGEKLYIIADGKHYEVKPDDALLSSGLTVLLYSFDPAELNKILSSASVEMKVADLTFQLKEKQLKKLRAAIKLV